MKISLISFKYDIKHPLIFSLSHLLFIIHFLYVINKKNSKLLAQTFVYIINEY